MTADDVVEVLGALATAEVEVWVDGGWGVDALVGRRTREHSDLDLAVKREDLEQAEAALAALAFAQDGDAEPGLPARLVMVDDVGREVDFHPLIFDRLGNGWQQLSASGRAWGCYEVEHLGAKGSIGRLSVRCLSPELQLRFRRGYEWTERDEHDIRLLAESFGLPLPPSLKP